MFALHLPPAQFASTTVQLTYTVWSPTEVYCLPGTDLQSQHLGAAAVGRCVVLPIEARHKRC